MNRQYCPECGHENPIEARFCMDCGHGLNGPARLAAGEGYRPGESGGTSQAYQRENGGTDWAAIAAAVLAFLSLRHMSRKARDTTIVVTFLVLFFGCPMVCGFVMFVLDWFARLFQ